MNELYYRNGRVETLKQRARRCCCKYCGGELWLKRITFSEYEDARVELYCEQCERIEYGTEPEIYQSAKRLVEQLDFQYYADLDDNEKTRRMNVAKVCELLAWSYQDLGLTNQDGFTVSLPKQEHNWDETIVLCDDGVPEEVVL